MFLGTLLKNYNTEGVQVQTENFNAAYKQSFWLVKALLFSETVH